MWQVHERQNKAEELSQTLKEAQETEDLNTVQDPGLDLRSGLFVFAVKNTGAITG